MAKATHMRCIQGGTVLDPRTGVEIMAVYDEIYAADQPLLRLAPHLFCEVGSEDHTPDPGGDRLAREPTGGNTIDTNPHLVRPNEPGVQWRR